MEKVDILVRQLQELVARKADPAEMLDIVQQLQQALTSINKPASRTLGTSKVAVVMPAGLSGVPAEYERYLPREAAPVATVVTQAEPEKVAAVVQQDGKLDMLFDPLMEIPTLSQQSRPKPAESRSFNPGAEPESLNDKLKQPRLELADTLKEVPVRDLRKAIGINDRFLFIDELFRGDEAMYERSIKTINGFNIYPEAEYWISRELKTKLGWSVGSQVVDHFDQLVRRRFASM